MNFVVNLNFMTQMTARDSKHINAAMNASAFSRRETREQVSVRSTQIGWQRNGKLRASPLELQPQLHRRLHSRGAGPVEQYSGDTAGSYRASLHQASWIIVLVILRQYAASASAVLCIPFAKRTSKSGDGIQYLQGSGTLEPLIRQLMNRSEQASGEQVSAEKEANGELATGEKATDE